MFEIGVENQRDDDQFRYGQPFAAAPSARAFFWLRVRSSLRGYCGTFAVRQSTHAELLYVALVPCISCAAKRLPCDIGGRTRLRSAWSTSPDRNPPPIRAAQSTSPALPCRRECCRIRAAQKSRNRP